MSKIDIKFGTSGWRGIISDDFTFSNVRLVSQAIADYINKKTAHTRLFFSEAFLSGTVVIGYDTRFLSENFAKASAEVLAANGIKVIYSQKDAPTPAISHYIIENKLSAGINITASHNPPEYSGIKFSTDWGGPALPEITQEIESICKKLQDNQQRVKRMEFNDALSKGLIEKKDISKNYIKQIRDIIDTRLIEENVSIAFDCMYGTAREYIGEIIPKAKMTLINDKRDVLFGGHRPEPAQKFLSFLIKEIINKKIDIGLATDGDGDRFGVIDSDGSFITPNQVMGLALYHLHKKGYRGVAARSVMTSSFMDAVGKDLGVEVIETPVGFKYIGDIFIKQDIIVGGEESGGLTIGGHIPEKDGILACLLMAELRAKENKSLLDILKMLHQRVGNFITVRKNYTLTNEKMEILRDNVEENPPDSFCDFKVEEINTIDGYKFLLDEKNSWLGLRFSGTEPVVRVYVESSTTKNTEGIITAAEKIFKLA